MDNKVTILPTEQLTFHNTKSVVQIALQSLTLDSLRCSHYIIIMGEFIQIAVQY